MWPATGAFFDANRATHALSQRVSGRFMHLVYGLDLHAAATKDGAVAALANASRHPLWMPQTAARSATQRAPAMSNFQDLPNIDQAAFDVPDLEKLEPGTVSTHPPRILILYGSLRDRSYSRFLAEEAGRILSQFGAEVQFFDPHGLPLPDGADRTHPKVQELNELSIWSEGHVWCSPERHGAMSGVLKTQIDWLPLSLGGIRPTQGRTLAVMQVCGGSQSFNAVNGMRILGRWMRMVTIPNQSSVAKAYDEFDDAGRMRPSPFYERVVDVMEELYKFTLLVRDRTDYLTDRYSERRDGLAKNNPTLKAAMADTQRK